jgi:Transmembrane protein 43
LGDRSAGELIEGKRKSEAILTWVLRGVGTLLMVVGFAIFLAPLSTLASVIPILGDLVGGAVTLVSVAIGVPLSILVIAFAWLTFRPLIGGGLILLALVVGYLLWRWRNPRASGTSRLTGEIGLVASSRRRGKCLEISGRGRDVLVAKPLRDGRHYCGAVCCWAKARFHEPQLSRNVGSILTSEARIGPDIAVACRARRYVRAWHTFDDQFPPPLHHRRVCAG